MYKNRWYSFATPVMTAGFAMHPEFCRRELQTVQKKEVHTVMADFARSPEAPYSFTQMKKEYAEFQRAVSQEQVCLCACVRACVCTCMRVSALSSVVLL